MKLETFFTLLLSFITWGFVITKLVKYLFGNNERQEVKNQIQKNQSILIRKISVVIFSIIRYSVIPILLLILAAVYALLPAFEAFLIANENGVCWEEKRKLSEDEIRIRAFTTYYNAWQKMFNSGDVGYARWEIIKRDLSTKELFDLHQKALPHLKEAEHPDHLKKLYLIEDNLPNVSSEEELILDILKNNYILVPSLFGLDREIVKVSSFKLHKKFNTSRFIDLLQGFGSYEFSIQNIRMYEKNNGIMIYEITHQINNCGDHAKEISSKSAYFEGNSSEITFSEPVLLLTGYLFSTSKFPFVESLIYFLKGV